MSETLLEIAGGWLVDHEADLCSGAWSGLPESLAALLTETRTKALEEAAALCDRYDDCSPSFIGERIEELKAIRTKAEGGEI